MELTDTQYAATLSDASLAKKMSERDSNARTLARLLLTGGPDYATDRVLRWFAISDEAVNTHGK